MSKRYMTVSDLTGDPIQSDEDIATIVIHDHPLIERPVQLDADVAELGDVKGSDKEFAIVEIIRDGGDKRERLVLELAEFEALFNKKIDVDDVLQNAEAYSDSPVTSSEPKRRGRPRGSSSAASTATKVDYKTLEHAGTPHRGRTTDEEARIVRENLEAVNKRRVEQGHAPIDPKDAKDATRYGFSQ